MFMENFITSKKIIKEILKTLPQRVSKLYIANNAFGDDIKEIISLAKKNKISFFSVPKQKLLEIFNQGYSGVLLVVSPVHYHTLEDLIKKFETKNTCVVLILDEINDPQNFGAILRTAAAFEVDGVIIQQWNQVQVTQTVVETSRGGVYHVPIAKVKNVYNAVKKLKEHNFWVYATAPPTLITDKSKVTQINNITGYNKIAVILGNESKGVRKNILNEADGIITIQHSDKIDSLNVSVTCGIILHYIYNNKKL